MKKSLFILLNILCIYHYSFSQSGWQVVPSGTNASLNAIYFANANTGYIAGNSGTILKSVNSGLSWTPLTAPPPTTQSFFDIFVDISGNVHTVSDIGNIYNSSTGGASWVLQPSGTNQSLNSIFFKNASTGYVSGNLGTELNTTNGGNNWNMYPPAPIPADFFDAGSDPFSGNIIFAGGVRPNGGCVIASSNNGANWLVTYTGTYPINTVVFNNTGTGFAAGQNGTIINTTNSGMNWAPQPSPVPIEIVSLSLVSTNPITVYGAGANGTIVKTSNSGQNWTVQYPPVVQSFFDVFFFDALHGFICGANGTILMTTTGGVTFINPISNNIPDKFELFQNYPNPFNPSTKIKFDVQGLKNIEQSVQLVVYNSLGQKIQTLLEENLQPGTYSVSWDASDSPAGVYFYKLISGSFVETKKMVLIK